MPNKYNAVPTQIDGWRFDSQLEGDVYLELKRLHDIGAIKGIRMQHPYPLRSHSGTTIGTYVADFRCLLSTGKIVVVEAKGFETAIWNRTVKHFTADYYPRVDLVVVKHHSQFPLELTTKVFQQACDRLQKASYSLFQVYEVQ
jgi:hypothetical protein